MQDNKNAENFDNFPDERDLKLLEKDKYTFSVLLRIIGGENDLLLTDHKRLIICFSCAPYPVWIWTSDDASRQEMQTAYELVRGNGLLDGTHTFNMKYGLSEYFIKRAARDKKVLSVQKNILAYDCPNLIEPHVRADGSAYRCTGKGGDELTELADFFRSETGIDRQALEVYRRKSEEAIESGNVFFWKDAKGRDVAVCNMTPNGNTACLGLVYTREEFRRKHYAENLVYAVTKTAKDAGYTPMLYTDADYSASNECYKKIGYVLKGKLCTVG